MESANNIDLWIEIWDHAHASIQNLSIFLLCYDCIWHLIELVELNAGVTLRLNIFICFDKFDATFVDFILLLLSEWSL